MSSLNPQHTEWILETIDHLRKRKARPDLQRICHVVRRRFGLPSVVTEARLEKLVDAETVIKVEYKGSTSYRNASKWRKNMIGCTVQNSSTVSTRIIEAILALSKGKGKCDTNTLKMSGNSETENDFKCKTSPNSSTSKGGDDEDGVMLENIETWLTKYCDGFKNLKSPLNVVLQREIDAGRIEKLERNGRFVISRAQKDELVNNDEVKLLDANLKRAGLKPGSLQECKTGDGGDKKDGKQVTGNTSKSSIVVEKKDNKPTVLHQPSRRGRPPKFRPPVESTTVSSQSTSKLKRPSSLVEDGKCPAPKISKKGPPHPSLPPDECHFCLRSSNKGRGEAMLVCKDCFIKAHPSCLNYNPTLASRAAKRPWQCMECKTCCLCKSSALGDLMLFCDGCDKGYHMTCHMPTISKKPSGPWECYDCRLENSNLGRNEFAAQHDYQNGTMRDSAPPTPSESPTPSSSADCQVYSDYPDASKWSADQVADYLINAGFEDEAKVFRDQEIDGVALLLMKRGDVLKGLDFKLGPALKVNRIIQGFQTARMS